MIKIAAIGKHLGAQKIDNYSHAEKLGFNQHWVDDKVGFSSLHKMLSSQVSSDLCVEAWRDLEQKYSIKKTDIELLILVTQHGDQQVPHTSAILQERLGLNENCACFDISLGCSGYVYGLSTAIGFMKQNGLKTGLLFTCDPYSRIIPPNDKDTSLIFSDAATVTLLNADGKYGLRRSKFLTQGRHFDSLVERDGKLQMRGAELAHFVLSNAPKQILELLDECKLTQRDVGKFVLHPGSEKLVKALSRLLNLEPSRLATGYLAYGNTVSSSIPFLLSDCLESTYSNILISGYGVGLSCASAILTKDF